jgi:hypothetical protein
MSSRNCGVGRSTPTAQTKKPRPVKSGAFAPLAFILRDFLPELRLQPKLVLFDLAAKRQVGLYPIGTSPGFSFSSG